MPKRFLLTANPPRMIISKSGYEAAPNLDEDFKIFDSNWFGGNGIKWVLRKDQYFDAQGDTPPWDVSTMTIDFPYALNYQPACVAFYCCSPAGRDWDRAVIKPHMIVWNDNKSVTVQAPFGGGYGRDFVPNYPGAVGGENWHWENGRTISLFVVVFESRPTQPRTEKTTRIVIGANPYDKRKGLWVTEPGCRAGDLKEPHIISSDNDYLKLHATGIVKPTENGSSGSKFWTADFYFPALPYFPIVFIQLAAKDVGKRILFPFDDNAKWNGVEGSTDIPGYSYIIYKDHVHLSTRPRNEVEKFDLRCLVFRNPLCWTL